MLRTGVKWYESFQYSMLHGTFRLDNKVTDMGEQVSLKSFGPADNNSRNENDSFNQFRVEQKQYYNGFVSWKDAGGSYFIATKDVRGWKR